MPAGEHAVMRGEGLSRPAAADFFAGSGLAGLGLASRFRCVWANDVSPKKAAIHRANLPDAVLEERSVADVRGADVPRCRLSWASFPCQDLSLAGRMAGLRGARSGLVREWLRIMDEMAQRPSVLAMENVTGLVSAEGGAHYRALHAELVARGLRAGALHLDAIRWLPQSRPRIFVVAVRRDQAIPERLLAPGPTWAHTPAIRRAAKGLEDWTWWNLPEPPPRRLGLCDLLDFDLPCHDAETSRRNLDLVPPAHRKRLDSCGLRAVPGYRRIRGGRQVLELRFDDVAGCLRTAAGGSSRQHLVIRVGDGWRTRMLAPREAARLMGAPENFWLPDSHSDAYTAMGDAVVVPVVRYLSEYLLAPLAEICHERT